jgi:hypothetical protein
MVFGLGLEGDEGPTFWITLFVFIVVIPYLALWPMVKLRSDGSLILRGWTRTRKAHISEIARLSLTSLGLRFEFERGDRFTSVIFQPTHHVRYPRVFDFVEAITGVRPSLERWNVWLAATPDGIQLMPTEDGN